MSLLTQFNGIIRLRKDTEYNFNQNPDFVLADGEVALVETQFDGIRIKIGDGITKWEELEYIDKKNNVIIRGFFYNGNFYYESAHTHVITPSQGKIYIDISTNIIYSFENNQFNPLNLLPAATATTAGVAKLYDELGDASDGSITQRKVTEEFYKKFEVEIKQGGILHFFH